MRYTKILSFFLGSLCLLCLACQNDDNFLEFKNPLPLKPQLLSGTWKAQKVVQVDKEALDNGFPEGIQQKDISALFPFEEYQVEFSLDAEGRPGSFTVTSGNAPNFLNLTNGVWSLDDLVFSRTITLSNPNEFQTSSFRIEVLNEDRIKLHVVRNDVKDNTEYSYYQYEFVKL